MKNLLLVLAIAFGSLTANAQLPPAPAHLINKTSCPIYVKLMILDGSCGLTLSTTYMLPPHTDMMSPPPPTGTWYDAALVDSSPTFTGTLYTKVSLPMAACTSYNVSEPGVTPCGAVNVTWAYTSTPTAPVLIIHD